MRPARVLLVEDDAGDATLVSDALAVTGEFACTWVRTLREAEQTLDASIGCVVLDLGLPDAEDQEGLEGLRRMLHAAPGAAVIVLTGLGDERRGAEALATGAQDYLVKGAVEGADLSRSVRYAIERKRGEETTRRLREAEMLGAENARLERGLLPRPLLKNVALRWATRYRPGGRRALLGGDFYDGVELEDGTIRVIVGDVSGHGPDEAALGVALRVAWRTLVLSGIEPHEVLPKLQRVLETERPADHVFATACDLTLTPDLTSADIRLAGHPAPLRIDGRTAEQVKVAERGPILGLLEKASWPALTLDLGSDWGLLTYTDGIIEGRDGGPGSSRLDDDGLTRLATMHVQAANWVDELVDWLIADAEDANGGPLSDDVALFLLCAGAPWCR
jgi:serine phosphatase RsbU (regulator of sigma subunit)